MSFFLVDKHTKFRDFLTDKADFEERVQNQQSNSSANERDLHSPARQGLREKGNLIAGAFVVSRSRTAFTPAGRRA
jgi:hypothetical protein